MVNKSRKTNNKMDEENQLIKKKNINLVIKKREKFKFQPKLVLF